MKSLNRSLVLNTIRIHESISRSEIAKKTKLTPPTVTNIVNELLKESLVVEKEPGVSSGGRKPILLTINSGSRCVIGIDVGVKKIRCALSDLNGRLIIKKLETIPTQLTKALFLTCLKNILTDFLQEIGAMREKVIGIGIAMHGIVDSEAGISLFAPSLMLENIPVKAELEAAFGLPVRIENDAKALAIGEKWFGNGKEVNDLITINIGEGIGAGVILNNRLYHGQDSLAGEIGHTIIDLDGPRCSCGNFGCFQTLASGQALRERALKEISLGQKTMLLEKAAGDLETIDGQMIYDCALAGDALSIQVLHQTARYIGVGIVNMIHFLNPSLVIIGGGVSKAKEFILEPIREVVERKALTQKAKQSDVIISALGEEGSLIGAVTLVLAELFATDYPD